MRRQTKDLLAVAGWVVACTAAFLVPCYIGILIGRLGPGFRGGPLAGVVAGLWLLKLTLPKAEARRKLARLRRDLL